MRTIQEKYRGVINDNYPKAQFIREARLEMPNFISSTNSFEDVVSILKNKGVLTEEKKEYSNPTPGYPLEALERGIDAELEAKGVNTATETPTEEEYDKAKEKAVKNLEKNPNHYLHLMSGDSNKVDKHDQFKEFKDKDKVDTINGLKKAKLNEDFEDYERLSREIEFNISSERDDFDIETSSDDLDKLKDELESMGYDVEGILANGTMEDLINSVSREDKQRLYGRYDVFDDYGDSVDEQEKDISIDKKISASKVMRIAKLAGNTVPDAEDEIKELIIRFGEEVPVHKVKDILNNYDLSQMKLREAANMQTTSKIGKRYLVDMGDGSQENLTVAKTFVFNPPKGKKENGFYSKEYGEEMAFLDSMIVKPVKEGIHDRDITSNPQTNAGLRTDISPQEEHIRGYMYIRKISPVLKKYNVSFKDFIRMAETDDLTSKELDDLDYIEDRIETHLSLREAVNEGRRPKLKGGKAIKENDYESGGYVDTMGPQLDSAINKVLKVWDQWRNGPMTEPGMIPFAKKDLIEYFSNKLEEKLMEEEKANKDYDGDGNIESPEDEYLGSRDKAIKANMDEQGVEKLKELFKKSIINMLQENKIPLHEASTENLEEFVHYENEQNEDLASRIRKGAAELEDVIGSLEKEHINVREKVEGIYKDIGSFMAPAVAAAFKKDIAPVLSKLHNIKVPKGKRLSPEEMEELGIDPSSTTGTVFSLKEGKKTKYTKRKN